jgi:crotonobetainyl-CoA:carnitine CoA-transferase CaiB-like acyl-CoA transferase
LNVAIVSPGPSLGFASLRSDHRRIGRRMPAMPGPLDGFRVLDIGTLFPSGFCSALLGDLGADVIKLEPPSGDSLRTMGAKLDGRSLTWAVVGRNKRSITLDLNQPRAHELLARLVARADLVVENLPQRSLERWHCTYDELARINPRLIVVSLSCYGRTGPYAERAGNGTLAEAFAGLTAMTGERDGPPMLTSLPIGDVLGAIFGTLGALAAAYLRDARGGRGQRVDASLYEPILQFLINGVPQFALTGKADRRSGSRIPGAVPRNTYRTRDGQWLALSAVTDRLVAALLEMMGRDPQAESARFGTVDLRRAHEEELDAEVAGWVAQRDASSLLDALVRAGIPAAPVNDVAAILSDPHVRARGSLEQIEDPAFGPLTLVASAPRLEGSPARVRSTGPELGAHNREIYCGELGLSEAELADLRAAGVV